MSCLVLLHWGEYKACAVLPHFLLQYILSWRTIRIPNILLCESAFFVAHLIQWWFTNWAQNKLCGNTNSNCYRDPLGFLNLTSLYSASTWQWLWILWHALLSRCARLMQPPPDMRRYSTIWHQNRGTPAPSSSSDHLTPWMCPEFAPFT